MLWVKPEHTFPERLNCTTWLVIMLHKCCHSNSLPSFQSPMAAVLLVGQLSIANLFCTDSLSRRTGICPQTAEVFRTLQQSVIWLWQTVACYHGVLPITFNEGRGMRVGSGRWGMEGGERRWEEEGRIISNLVHWCGGFTDSCSISEQLFCRLELYLSLITFLFSSKNGASD